MNRSKFFAYALAAWLLLEALAFVIVVELFGVTAALALALATTLIGLFDIKKLFDYLRRRSSAGRAPKEGEPKPDMVETGLHALATTLLILPGFASDLVGLALKAPSIRAGLAKRLRGESEGRRGPRTIDLKPNEWKSLDAPRKRRRVAKSSGAPPAG
ncbi:FxsA family protein [Methylocystis bryophila]|uniref:Exlusion protein FxsA n=1 Tax=Methylocystis bryophila TaxID=655015 RepID=A0A1W6N1M1_9HYPH|nr:FxsA family protein [Methylocystis bryophila]ARN83719.1 exlusion protein FxsA [Methylocystis bryophila]BDV38541.1 membrane protein [Methylocystis bryophila]